ncbi:MAG: hypothetical protein AAFY71_21925 [Bacteroidota bacterium]
MPIAYIVSLVIGVIALAGITFVIADSRAYKRRNAEAAARARGQRTTVNETEVA